MLAAENADTSGVTVVLVHGAGHGAWCWEEVVDPLRSRGWRVRAVDLPMSSLDDDASTVRSAVDEAHDVGDRVLLVAHSYGGVVASAAGHDADELLFCAAMIPQPGQATADLAGSFKSEPGRIATRMSDDGTTVWFDPALAIPAFLHRTSDDQARRSVARLRPMGMGCLTGVVEHPAWLDVPSSYVVSADDRSVDVEFQRAWAQRWPGSVTLDADHSPFFSATEELVAHIDRVATRVGARVSAP